MCEERQRHEAIGVEIVDLVTKDLDLDNPYSFEVALGALEYSFNALVSEWFSRFKGWAGIEHDDP